MENNFYRDHFEQLLKDSSDNFRLYPSRRIWHSIYNDLHPGKKWPSIAVLVLLMFAITYIGITNPTITPPQAMSKMATEGDIIISQNTKFSPSIIRSYASAINRTPIINTNQHFKFQFVKANLQNFPNSTQPEYNLNSTLASNTGTDINDLINPVALNTNMPESNPDKVTNVNSPTPSSGEVAKGDKEWIEDYALHNINPQSKERQRWAFQLYATPSVGYRILQKSDDLPETNNRSMVSGASEDEYYLNQSSALNLEAGGNLLYSISERFRVKAGIQFNYTNYNISAYDLHHPVSSNLLVTDINNGLTELLPKASTLSNAQTEETTNYNNNTYQLSVPLGADVQILGNSLIKWFAGATIQPTYITGGNSFLISSDLKNYINDASFMRKFNMNGGLETFVSYKLKTGLILNAGPQVRYQFLSTYNDQYNYKEKLFNFGIKLGITSKF